MTPPSKATPEPTRVDERRRTRAAQIAHAIEMEIMRRGWPLGESIGSETELIERYGVGRPVLREAFRILESRWVAKPRPGPGGGLLVTAPQRSSVRDVVRLFISYTGFAQQDLFTTWETLELAAIEELCRTIDDDGVEQLRAVVRNEDGVEDLRTPASTVHTEIGRLSGNPFLELFIYVLSDLSRHHGVPSTPAQRQWLHTKHKELAEAIIAGNALHAQRALRGLLRALSRAAAVDAQPAARGSATNRASESG